MTALYTGTTASYLVKTVSRASQLSPLNEANGPPHLWKLRADLLKNPT
jgi:hypothetical protein